MIDSKDNIRIVNASPEELQADLRASTHLNNRYSILDQKTEEPVLGLTDLTIDHAQMLMLVPPPGKPFSRFELGERVYCTAKTETYLVVRTK